MAIYSHAFADLWEDANKLARSKRFVTVNVGMGHSMSMEIHCQAASQRRTYIDSLLS